MKVSSVEYQPSSSEIGVYDCEIRLKFRLIEEKSALRNREQLLDMLLDAIAYGADEYLEMLQSYVDAHEVPEVEASPQLRRQLIRLRNSKEIG